jgi:hypothetical protein
MIISHLMSRNQIGNSDITGQNISNTKQQDFSEKYAKSEVRLQAALSAKPNTS